MAKLCLGIVIKSAINNLGNGIWNKFARTSLTNALLIKGQKG